VSESAILTVEQRPPPRQRPALVANGVAAIVLAVFAEAMMFAGMISAHTIVKSRSVGRMWPPFGQPRLPVEETAFNTAALLISGLVLVFAHFAYKKKPTRALIPLTVSILLGMFFLVFQGVEWVALLNDGLTMFSSSYGAFFYLIVGSHALHTLGALIGMMWAWSRLRSEKLSATEFGAVQVFWYFVVLLWPVLYLKVYL
jgi:cytochrome c oxidase subunit III